MEARSHTLAELEAHLLELHMKDPSLLPVSPLRLHSYLNNPRSKPSDHVLFEMWDENRLVAYRTLLPDHLFDRSGNPHRFAWLSGNYVAPEYRRKGISTLLLQLVEEKWEGQLMYTNYAPASKAVYDRSGQFSLLEKREGTRYYLRAASAELARGMFRHSRVCQLGDQLVNSLINLRLNRFRSESAGECSVTRVSSLDQEMSDLMDAGKEDALFRRDAAIFKWILQYPWVTRKQLEKIPYHFSYGARQFENMLYRFEAGTERETGFMWVVIHDRKFTVPYLFCSHEKLLPHMARTCLEIMILKGSAFATIRHSGLRAALQPFRKWFLAARNMPQRIFIHHLMERHIPETFTLQDGDGDVVFTG